MITVFHQGGNSMKRTVGEERSTCLDGWDVLPAEWLVVVFPYQQCFFEKTAAILAGWGNPLVRNSFIHCLGSFFFRYAPS